MENTKEEITKFTRRFLIVLATFLIVSNSFGGEPIFREDARDTIIRRISKTDLFPYPRNGIAFNVLSISFPLGISYDFFVHRNICFEIGIGPVTLPAGIKLYPFVKTEKRRKFEVYLGVYNLFMWSYNGDWQVLPFKTLDLLYFPIGLQYFSWYSFSLSVELGITYELTNENYLPILWPGVKITKRFDGYRR